MELHKPPQRARHQRGASLIEVLVATVVLSLGVLAMAGLQLSGMRTSEGALLRSQSATLATDIVERMRANLSSANAYSIAFADADPTGVSLRDLDLRDWRARLRGLPNGRGEVDVALDPVTGRAGEATVRVRWDDRRAGGEADETLTLVVRLSN